MAFSYVQGIDVYSTDNLTLNGVGVGNLLVAFGASTNDPPCTAVSGGGTWVALTSNKNIDYASNVRLFYCLSATGGNSTFSVTGGSGDFAWGVAEFSKTGSAAYDTQYAESLEHGETTSWTTNNITVTNNSSLIFCAIHDYGSAASITYTAPLTKISDLENIDHFHSSGYQVVTTSGNYVLSGTRGAGFSNMIIGVAVFYEVGASATTLPRRALDGPFYGSLRGSVR